MCRAKINKCQHDLMIPYIYDKDVVKFNSFLLIFRHNRVCVIKEFKKLHFENIDEIMKINRIIQFYLK